MNSSFADIRPMATCGFGANLMRAPLPFFRETGAGPGIVCLHANASHSGQWRSLMDRLGPKFHVLAADAYGAGNSPAWSADRRIALRDEVSFLEPVFARAGESFTLVGHSYGAAVALVAAIAMPERIRALALYEPTLFSLLDAETPPPNEADGIREAVKRAVAALAAGRKDAAAEHFIDYWMGAGAWASMPEKRREPIAASVVNIQSWADALSGEAMSLSALESLDIPVLCMIGNETRASARGVTRLLATVLPRMKLVELQGMGHMGPVTHPETVNGIIAEFVECLLWPGVRSARQRPTSARAMAR